MKFKNNEQTREEQESLRSKHDPFVLLKQQELALNKLSVLLPLKTENQALKRKINLIANSLDTKLKKTMICKFTCR